MASQQQIYGTLLQVGASPAEARTLSAIAMAESGGNGGAYNPNGEDSVGWYQINLRAHGTQVGGSMTDAMARDPVASSQYALQLYRDQGPRPWSVTHEANGKPYRKYMNTPLEPVALPRTGGPMGDDTATATPSVGGVPPGYRGEEEDDGKSIVGQIIVYNGQPLQITSITPRGTMRGIVPGSQPNPMSDTISTIEIPIGTYQLHGLNKSVQVLGDGSMGASGATPAQPDPAKGPYTTQYDDVGLPVRVYADGSVEQLPEGQLDRLLGTGGSSPTPYGYTAPDPGGALSAIFKRYEYEMLDANRPREEAQQNFDNALSAFEALQRGEINYAQFLQNAAISEGQLTQGRDSQLIDIAKAQEEGTRAREIANQSSKLQIADMRRQMGTDFMRDAMPKALPSNVTGIQIPGFGGGFNMPTMQYSPDQVYGIDALNQVPTVNPNVGAFPTPSPVAPIPVPQLTAPPAILNQPLPTAQMPQIPNVQSIIDQMLNGSGPLGWA